MKKPKTSYLPQVRCYADLREAAQKLADKRNLDLSDIVRDAVIEYVKREGKGKQ